MYFIYFMWDVCGLPSTMALASSDLLATGEGISMNIYNHNDSLIAHISNQGCSESA